nr:immunoglobulin light chain junction region [Macaca mulatta]
DYYCTFYMGGGIHVF